MTQAIALAPRAETYARRLAEQGWCIVRNALPAERLEALDRDLEVAFAETPFGQGSFYGDTTKRFGRILTRSPVAAELVQHPIILETVEQVLGAHCDCIQLNVGQAIAVHPGAPAQAPHRDQDMWRGTVGGHEYLVNVMWPLTPFRADNGATTIWPRSHGAAALDAEPSDPPVASEMMPGSALLFLGSTLHAAGANRSQDVRRGVVVGYSLGWLKPYENMPLAYPPAIARDFPPELAALIGYRQHRPNLGNYEGQCPSILLANRKDGPLGAVDALRPDQQEMVDAYARAQEATA